MSSAANDLLARPELGRLSRGALSLEAAAPRGFCDGVLVTGVRDVG